MGGTRQSAPDSRPSHQFGKGCCHGTLPLRHHGDRRARGADRPRGPELTRRGHEVTWYTSKHFEDKITATGATFAPLVSPIDFGDGEYSKHFPGRDKY